METKTITVQYQLDRTEYKDVALHKSTLINLSICAVWYVGITSKTIYLPWKEVYLKKKKITASEEQILSF